MAFTPPVSPFDDPSIGEDSCPCFRSTYGLACDADIQRGYFNKEGLVRSGEAVLITKPQLLLSRNNSSFILFGVPLETDSASCKDLERLFFLARKRLCNLAAAVKTFGATSVHFMPKTLSDSDCAEYRKDLRDFYIMIRYFLANQDEGSEWVVEEMSETIKSGLSLLRLELGWLSDLPRYVLEYANSSNSKSSPAYHLFHAHLELRWLHMSVLHQLHTYSNPNQIDFSKSFPKSPDVLSTTCYSAESVQEAVLITIVDLTWMAVVRFNQSSRDELVSRSMFNCLCVKELWLLLLVFIGKIHEGSDHKHPFWSLMDDVTERLSSSEDHPKKIRRTDLKIPDTIICENPSLFSLWLLSNLAELFLYDDNGNLQKYKLDGNECNYLALKRALTQLIEGSYNLTEEDRRVVVHLVCVLLDQYGDPKPDPIMILWECFFRSLDLPFQLPGTRAGGFAVLSDTPRGLIDSVNKILNVQPKMKSNTSYEAFLHLLGSHLERSPLHWKQKMRGRVFSKLSPKKVSSLSELGLFHLIQFFFTVALKSDLQDTAAKLNDLLSSIDDSSDTKRRTLSVMARIALVQMMAENLLPIGNVLKPLVSDVSLFVSRGQFEIPRLFVDSVEDIIKCNDSLELDQHFIIGDWIKQYLERLNHDSYNPVLHALVTIMKKLRCNINYGSMGQGPVKFMEALLINVMPFVKQQMTSGDLAPFLVADLAAHFTLLSLEFRRPPSQAVKPESFNQLIKKFVESDSSNVMLVRRYLWLVLSEKQNISNALERCSEQEHLIITQAWIRISLFSTNTNHEEYQSLTYEIFRLPLINRLFNISWEELEQIANEQDPFISLVKCIDLAVKTGTNPAVIRRNFDKLTQTIYQWLRNIKLYYSPQKGKDGSRPPFPNPPNKMMGQPAKEALSRLYFCLGTIFMECSATVFVRNTADCLLVKSVPIILLPSALYDSDTQLSVPLDEAIRSSLDRFIIGLFRLDPVRELCIKRYFKDVVSVFVPRMITMGGPMGGVAQHNPFKQLWASNEKIAQEAAALVIQHVGEVFIDNPKRSQYALAVKYILGLLKGFPNNEELYRSVITHVVAGALEVSTKCTVDNAVVQDTNNIIQFVLKSSLYAEKEGLRSALNGALQQLSAKYLSFNPDLFFRILSNFGREFPRVVKNFLPTLEEDIKAAAKRRGVGTDRKLQSLFDGLANALK